MEGGEESVGLRGGGAAHLSYIQMTLFFPLRTESLDIRGRNLSNRSLKRWLPRSQEVALKSFELKLFCRGICLICSMRGLGWSKRGCLSVALLAGIRHKAYVG